MHVDLVKSSILDALDFCHKYSCMSCPKEESCNNVFHSRILEEEIYNFALKCLQFNEFEES